MPALLGTVAGMNTHTSASGYRWAITDMARTRPAHRTGQADTLTSAWTAALTAARAALVAGDLDDLAVLIDDQLEAIYLPARDDHDQLDPAEVTAALVDIHHDVTAHQLAAQLAAPTG